MAPPVFADGSSSDEALSSLEMPPSSGASHRCPDSMYAERAVVEPPTESSWRRGAAVLTDRADMPPAKVEAGPPIIAPSGSAASFSASSSSASSSVGGTPAAPTTCAVNGPLARSRRRRPRLPLPSASPDANASTPPPLNLRRCLRSWFVTSAPSQRADAMASHVACSATRSSRTSIAAAVSSNSDRASSSCGIVPRSSSATMARNLSTLSCSSPPSGVPVAAAPPAARPGPPTTSESPITWVAWDCCAREITEAALPLPAALASS